MSNTILVTGAAGFIGFHLCEKLLKEGYNVIGLDNINNYYDSNLKYDRLKKLGITTEKAKLFSKKSSSIIHLSKFQFIRTDINDKLELSQFFANHNIKIVCNMAAQAGVRYSLENPEAYKLSNLSGFLNILECCRDNKIKKLVYASSSSVYGNNSKIPYHESDIVDKPISLYAATKKSNELMAHTYSHLFEIETIGLRFFTVYGPYGRPDMAISLFTNSIINKKPINVYNNGNLSRDFTYIDDIINGVYKVLTKKSSNSKKYKIYNIGNNKSIKLLDFIEKIEDKLGMKSDKNFLTSQPGDVNQTWADISEINKDFGYYPKTSINIGVDKFVKWYKEYYLKKRK